MKEIRNIGILAHVDAGKTTLTEQFLYLSGAIRNRGSVDKGSAVTDNLEVEKNRGISIRSASVSFNWQQVQVNLIDTPGHADFASEVERSLGVLDAAILVVSAVEGVQSHTFLLWEALQNLKIPLIIFINKADRMGSDYVQVIKEIEGELKAKVFPMVSIRNESSNEILVEDLWGERELYNEEKALKVKALEHLAELDENILEDYLEGRELKISGFKKSLEEKVKTNMIVPVFGGVAKSGLGIEALLNAVVDYFPGPEGKKEDTLSAQVYKIEHDKSLGRLAHIRVFSGVLNVRDTVQIIGHAESSKIGQIKKAETGKLQDIKLISAGDIGVINGIPNILPGDVIGKQGDIPKVKTLQEAVLLVKVHPQKPEDYGRLGEALEILNYEDPKLDFRWYKDDQEMQVRLMGAVHQEIIGAVLLDRFALEADFSEPTVVYRETPVKKAEGYIRYTMPKPCWAVLRFEVEPGEPGSGVQYESLVSVDAIHRKYQNEVEQTIRRSLEQGPKGWEVSDIRIRLVDGEDHEIHSRPGDFILATPMGIARALEAAGTKLLEPVLSYHIRMPEDYLGALASDLNKRRAEIGNPQFDGNQISLKGRVPVASSLDMPLALNSLSSGRAKLRLNFDGYTECSDGEDHVRDYRGVNPLDESKWILHYRGAYKADERSV